MTPGPIDRDPFRLPAPPREPRWVTAVMTSVAWLVGFVFLALILRRGHA